MTSNKTYDIQYVLDFIEEETAALEAERPGLKAGYERDLNLGSILALCKVHGRLEVIIAATKES